MAIILKQEKAQLTVVLAVSVSRKTFLIPMHLHHVSCKNRFMVMSVILALHCQSTYALLHSRNIKYRQLLWFSHPRICKCAITINIQL